MSLLLLGVGGSTGVAPVDPHGLTSRTFEIDAYDNSGLYSAISPGVVLCNDGDLCLAWQDLSITGVKSPVQSTAGNRGTARNLGAFWGVEFDGVDNLYVIQDGGVSGATFGSCTIYSVLSVDSIVSGGTIFSSNSSDAFQDRYGKPSILRNSVEDLGSATNAPSLGTRFVDCITYTGSLFTFERNLVANGTISTVKTFGTASNLLGATGGGEYLDGYIHYRAVFSTVHDAATKAGVQQFLKTRFQVS